jgi:hypothetical protein
MHMFGLCLVGIPQITGGVEAEMQISTTETYTYGQVEEKSKTYIASFPVNAKAGTNVRCVATVSKGNLTVPFTITLKSKSNGVQTEMRGIWTGVSTWDLRANYFNVDKAT